MLLEAVFRFHHATANKEIVVVWDTISHSSRVNLCSLSKARSYYSNITSLWNPQPQVNLHVPVMINRLRLPFLE